jgi:hypothetical protein
MSDEIEEKQERVFSLTEKLNKISLTVQDVVIISEQPIKLKLLKSSARMIFERIAKLNVNFVDARIIYEENITITEALNLENYEIKNCEFKEELSINTITHSLTFENCNFLKVINLNNSYFRKQLKFSICIFGKGILAIDTVFDSALAFHKCIFESDQQFYSTKFIQVCVFSNVQFKGALQFLHSKVGNDTYVNFENIIFYKGIDISRSNFYGITNFWCIRNKNEDFKLLVKESLYTKDSLEENSENINEISAIQKIRESYRIIKHSFRTNANNIEALVFHRLEMEAYAYELKGVKSKSRDSLILFFNKWSNNYGADWRYGLIFTLFVTVIVFFFQIMVVRNNLLSICYWCEEPTLIIKSFFQLLNITNWDYKPFDIEVVPDLNYVILFVGRIFIGYGYYQTIQSFRKFGKN